MSAAPREETRVHTRILNCTLEVENARAYWAETRGEPAAAEAQRAFQEYWFGARSLSRARLLLRNFRARFAAYPGALRVLQAWSRMDPGTRTLICHWHLQLSDPLYRAFCSELLVQRRAGLTGEISRDVAFAWVEARGPGRWTVSTRLQFASQLLSAACAAGLVGSKQDPRPLVLPHVGDDALTYLLYLLRETRFAGTILRNPYLSSVGLTGPKLEGRLRGLPALRFHRQGSLSDFGWTYADLGGWAAASLNSDVMPPEEGAA